MGKTSTQEKAGTNGPLGRARIGQTTVTMLAAVLLASAQAACGAAEDGVESDSPDIETQTSAMKTGRCGGKITVWSVMENSQKDYHEVVVSASGDGFIYLAARRRASKTLEDCYARWRSEPERAFHELHPECDQVDVNDWEDLSLAKTLEEAGLTGPKYLDSDASLSIFKIDQDRGHGCF